MPIETCVSAGDEQFTDLAEAVALTAIPEDLPGWTLFVIVQARGQDVNMRCGGDADSPTPTRGHTIFANTSFEYTGDDLSQLRFIEVSPGATLNVMYFKRSFKSQW